MKKAVINYQKTTGIAREEQIYENRIYRMRKYGFCMISGMLKKGLYKKDEIIVSNLTEEGANEAEKSWEWLQPWITMKVVKNTKTGFPGRETAVL